MWCHTWYWSKKLYRCTFCLQLVITSDGAVCFTAEAGCAESHRAQRYGNTPILINLLHCCQTSWTSSFSVPSFVSFCHCWLGLGQFLLFFVVLLLLQVWPSIHGLLTTEGAAEFWKHHDVRLGKRQFSQQFRQLDFVTLPLPKLRMEVIRKEEQTSLTDEFFLGCFSWWI